MMYRLMSKDCRWSLLSVKDKPSTMCCLFHHPEVKVTSDWKANVKYDPNSSEQQPFDIVVDAKGNILR
jgi:hypothetical protein